MLSFILHATGALVCFAAGYYTHYRWGSLLASDVQKVKGIV